MISRPSLQPSEGGDISIDLLLVVTDCKTHEFPASSANLDRANSQLLDDTIFWSVNEDSYLHRIGPIQMIELLDNYI